MPKLSYTFDHAVQHVYKAGVPISHTTITSGKAYIGYESINGFENAYNGNYYELDVYFNIPSGAYEYQYKASDISGIVQSTVLTTNTKNETKYSTTYDYYITDNWITEYKKSYEMLPHGPSKENGLGISEADVRYMQEMNPNIMKVTFKYIHPADDVTENIYGTITRRQSQLTTIGSIENIVIEHTVNEVVLNINPTYPVNVYLRNDRDCVFSWDISNSLNRPEQYLYATGYELNVYKADGTFLFSKTGIGNNQYVTISASELSSVTGDIKYTLKVATNYSYVNATTGYIYFILTGETNAPNIDLITQNSFPTIYWSCDNQISWQMIIKDSKDIVFESGMQSGTDKSFKIPKMLDDGTYSIEMRVLNQFGIYTDWTSTSFVLKPPKPQAPNKIIVSVNNDFSVNVFCNPFVESGILYVVKRKNSESKAEIVGEYYEGFIDSKVPLNDNYEYAVRNYVTGYSDSIWMDATVETNGIIIRDADDLKNYVHIYMTTEDDFDVYSNNSRSDTLMQCIGRTFPVAELGEWITSTRTFSGYVSNEDFSKLTFMKTKSKNIIFQNNKEVIPCYMELSDSGQYFKDGRMVSFSLTRIDGE